MCTSPAYRQPSGKVLSLGWGPPTQKPRGRAAGRLGLPQTLSQVLPRATWVPTMQLGTGPRPPQTDPRGRGVSEGLEETADPQPGVTGEGARPGLWSPRPPTSPPATWSPVWEGGTSRVKQDSSGAPLGVLLVAETIPAGGSHSEGHTAQARGVLGCRAPGGGASQLNRPS